MTAENGARLDDLLVVSAASMRPRPMTAENAAGLVRDVVQAAVASMRPRPMTAENPLMFGSRRAAQALQ